MSMEASLLVVVAVVERAAADQSEQPRCHRR